MRLELAIDNIKWDTIGISKMKRSGEEVEMHNDKYILFYISETPVYRSLRGLEDTRKRGGGRPRRLRLILRIQRQYTLYIHTYALASRPSGAARGRAAAARAGGARAPRHYYSS
ncbi:hypothetical protein EVAR_9469_1 [Eumeta japonica]|uniref:Uncharacterized protein n=1 Tax=Eumeta variegata TaxID=151549 RepID=A0A4C1UDE1_EUMVA|nr:hypothetical protein EVAR_9469_1 [Eumeta japonica]